MAIQRVFDATTDAVDTLRKALQSMLDDVSSIERDLQDRLNQSQSKSVSTKGGAFSYERSRGMHIILTLPAQKCSNECPHFAQKAFYSSEM